MDELLNCIAPRGHAPMTLAETSEGILQKTWKEISRLAENQKLQDWLPDTSLAADIRSCVGSKVKTYRYVLPTQLVAKVANASLDCRCLQSSRGGPGSFDARTIAHSVVVPFDQANESVLGGSLEPYVNNPLRVAEVSKDFRSAQKYPQAWDELCRVLDAVEARQSQRFTLAVFKQVLTEVYRRLSLVRVVYPTPRRASLSKTLELIATFSTEQSGGDRLLALTSALFLVIGSRFGLFSDVRRAKITAADQPSGMLADLECVSKTGEVVIVVEVKDRRIRVGQLRAKMKNIRERQVSEIFFVAQGAERSEREELRRVIDREFISGFNIYVTDLISLSDAALSLLGEAGRRQFLVETANQLENYHSEVVHRRAWAALLATV